MSFELKLLEKYGVGKYPTTLLKKELWKTPFNFFSRKMHIHLHTQNFRSSRCGAVETNPTSIHKDAGSIPDLTHAVG